MNPAAMIDKQDLKTERIAMTQTTNEQGNAQGELEAEKTSDHQQAQGNEQTDPGNDRDRISRHEHREAIAEVVREREHWKQRSKSVGADLEQLKKHMPAAEELAGYRKWLETHEQAEIDLAAVQVELEKEHSELIKAHQQELDKREATMTAQQRHIEQLVRDNRIIAAAERANVANAQAVARLFGPHVKVQHNENGEHQAVVLDESGQVVRDADTHQPISVEQGLGRYLARAENAFLLKAPAAGGSGAGVIAADSGPLDLAGMQRRLQKARNRKEFEAIVRTFNRQS